MNERRMAALKHDSSESESDDGATTHRSMTGMKDSAVQLTDLHHFSISLVYPNIY